VSPISRWHGGNPHVGCKLVKELQPLAFFFSLCISFIPSESLHLDQECHDTGRQARPYHDARGATRTRLASIQEICTCFLLFSKERRDNWRRMCLDRMNNLIFFHPNLSYLHKSKKINCTSYHYYPLPMPSGGLRAIKEGAYNASKFEAARTWVQRASASSFVRSTLRPNPSTSRLVFSSGKCDTVATNAKRDPQWTPLAAAGSLQSSSSSTTVDIDAAKEDGPSVPPSTRSQTHVAKACRASSSAPTSRHVDSSTLSYS
jgi:hypothetical protein